MEIVLVIFLLITFFIIYIKILDKKLLHTVTKSNRGTKTERNLVLELLKSKVPAQTIFHDLYLKKHDGTYSQIDLVVATKVGLIVFEVKNYSGWIFGKGYQPQWTQVLAYGKRKYRFYNPILQNNKHIEELKKQSKQFENLPFFSIVVFYGDCQFKDVSFVPEGTYLTKSRHIQKVVAKILKENAPANYSNKSEVVSILKDAVKTGESRETQIQHVENIQDMIGKHRIFE